MGRGTKETGEKNNEEVRLSAPFFALRPNSLDAWKRLVRSRLCDQSNPFKNRFSCYDTLCPGEPFVPAFPFGPYNLEETEVRFLSKSVKYIFLLGLISFAQIDPKEINTYAHSRYPSAHQLTDRNRYCNYIPVVKRLPPGQVSSWW